MRRSQPCLFRAVFFVDPSRSSERFRSLQPNSPTPCTLNGSASTLSQCQQIKRLLLAARAKREAAVARVRAGRVQARLDSERAMLGQIDDSTGATTDTASAQDENVTSAAVPASANENLPTKLMPVGVGGSATAAKSGDGKGTLERAALTPSNAAVGGEVGKDRPERARGEAPPWKGFTLDDGKLGSSCSLVL